MSLSAMLFIFPFKNRSVFSYIPYDRKRAPGAVAEAAAVAVAAVKMAAPGMDSFSRVVGCLVALFAASSLFLLRLCLIVPIFCFR